MMLPHIQSRGDYRAVYTDDVAWLPAMGVICTRHGLDPAGLHRLGLGTHVLFRTGRTVIKLFCPLWEQDHPAEKATLELIRGLPTPELIAIGLFEEWPYMLMTAVPGLPAYKVWDDLDERDQLFIVNQLGGLIGKLHQHAPIAQLATDWEAFLEARLSRWVERHDPSEPWTSWLAERLDRFTEPPFEPILLHADITNDNLLLSESGSRWRISGFIDFGDAMMGHPYYEFVAPLTYYTLGRPQLSRLLLESYGLELTPERAQRLTTYCFLHRFGRLSDYLARYPMADGPSFHRALWGDI
jgi:hygromycin-B 7''-O-kinase